MRQRHISTRRKILRHWRIERCQKLECNGQKFGVSASSLRANKIYAGLWYGDVKYAYSPCHITRLVVGYVHAAIGSILDMVGWTNTRCAWWKIVYTILLLYVMIGVDLHGSKSFAPKFQPHRPKPQQFVSTSILIRSARCLISSWSRLTNKILRRTNFGRSCGCGLCGSNLASSAHE